MAKKKRRLKLSKSKQKWVDTNPTAVMRGAPLNYPVTLERKYATVVTKILDHIMKVSEREVIRIFKSPTAVEFYAEDAAEPNLASMAHKKMDALFIGLELYARKRAMREAKAMVKGVNKSSQSSMAASLKEISGGVTLKPSLLGGKIPEMLQAAINVNADLIVTIAMEHMSKVESAVNRSIMLGNGLEDLIPFFRSQSGISKRHGRNMALDQYRKAYSSLNKVRMESAGLSKFEWLHSGGGQKPRKFHQDQFPKGLNGGIYDINDPPVIKKATRTKPEERGLPAWLPNCKCRMVPVIVLDDGEMI